MRYLLICTLCAVTLLIPHALVSAGRAQDNQAWMNDVFGDRDRRARRARQRNAARNLKIDRASSNEVLLSLATLRSLDVAIDRYRNIIRQGAWRRIPGRRSIRTDTDNERVRALRLRLLASGDMPPGSARYSGYDETLKAGVANYQRRSGLTPTGVANSRTLAMLNVSARQRLRQLRLNRSRLADLLTRVPRDRYIVVNIPAYELQAVAGGRVELFSRVIVGKPTTPTPEISAHVKAVNLLPYWHVPQTIARRALIPKIKQDILYLDREHIRVFSSWGGEEVDPQAVNWWSPQGQRYVFRQDPGPFNALGVVRLDMPNREIVYMHDTPLKRLFNYALRPYSAGCVRVQRVLDLAGWLARPGNGIGRRNLVQMIDAGQRETIRLQQPVPVFFAYISAWGSRDGTIHFRADIYDKDQEGTNVATSAPWGKADVRVTP